MSMRIKAQIDNDLKTAMLAGNKELATILRGLKSSILNVEIANNQRDKGLDDEDIVAVLQKEAKRRQESADMYLQGGSQERAQAEIAEKAIIEKYLPTQLTEEELYEIIDKTIEAVGASGPQDMGRVIGAVKQEAGGKADGASIARIVKQRLSQ